MRLGQGQSELSVVRDLEIAERGQSFDLDNLPELTTRHKIVLATLAAESYCIWSINYGWYIQEISTAFRSQEVCSPGFSVEWGRANNEHFVSGAKSVVFGALLVGVSKAIPSRHAERSYFRYCSSWPCSSRRSSPELYYGGRNVLRTVSH